MIAKRKFVGVVDGKEKTFAVGDPISASEAKQLNLAAKPNLVEKKAKHEAE